MWFSQMLKDASNAIKRHAPGLHGFFKSVYLRSGLPAFRFLNGRVVLVAPKLIASAPTEPHILEWINALMKPGDTFFDVGAHHGWMSMVACHRVGASGKVVAFEPSAPLVECLEYNKKTNRLHQMEIVPKAVADCHTRNVPFYVVNRGESFLNSLIDHRSTRIPIEQATMTEVETISLDEFCESTQLRPNAVKIDIEGAELLALRGSTRLLEQRRTTFLVAVHPCWLPEGQAATEIFELFKLYGYKVTASNIVPHEGIEFGDYVFAPEGS
jgi:FkbM family methyltransferase